MNEYTHFRLVILVQNLVVCIHLLSGRFEAPVGTGATKQCYSSQQIITRHEYTLHSVLTRQFRALIA